MEVVRHDEFTELEAEAWTAEERFKSAVRSSDDEEQAAAAAGLGLSLGLESPTEPWEEMTSEGSHAMDLAKVKELELLEADADAAEVSLGASDGSDEEEQTV